jgi:hypothetical protein
MNRINRVSTFCFRFVLATLVASAVGLASQKSADDRAGKLKLPSPKYEAIVLRGKVVELGPHLLQAFNVSMDDDEGKAVVALVTDSGDVYPLVKDVRSRGFWMDKRLRDRPMELHVHRFHGLPFVRVIDTYSFKDGKKYAVDYWCIVCAITTFEPGPCPCCQDPIELRERPVDQITPR